MAKSKPSSSDKKGSLMSMRSGFQKAAGRRRGQKKKASFAQVLVIVAGITIVLALALSMAR